MKSMKLAAVVYEKGGGARLDELLADVARRLQTHGRRLGGAVQINTDGGDRCRCDMILEDLGSGRRVEISEDRGPLARGCRLNSQALEEIVGLSQASLENGIDLLLINKFGKREAEGHGFRQAIESAWSSGTPVLVAVAQENLPAWQTFSNSLDERLPADVGAVTDWCLTVTGQSLQLAPATC